LRKSLMKIQPTRGMNARGILQLGIVSLSFRIDSEHCSIPAFSSLDGLRNESQPQPDVGEKIFYRSCR
jgi:hypothetical protein